MIPSNAIHNNPQKHAGAGGNKVGVSKSKQTHPQQPFGLKISLWIFGPVFFSLSPVALFPSMASNQEPAVDTRGIPTTSNLLPEPCPGVGKGVRILGLNFGLIFVKMRDSAVWRLLQKTHQKFAPKFAHPFGKFTPKSAPKTPRQKAAHQNRHQIRSQNDPR